MTKKKGESFGEMVTRLHDLVKKWMTGCETVEAVLEKMVVEQLINTMSGELKVWVSERKPKTDNKAGELADDYMRARGHDGAVKDQFETKDKGVEARKCHNCGKEGHLVWYCTEKSEDEQPKGAEVKMESKKTKADVRKVKCYNCGELGHISINCPEKALFCDGGLAQKATRKGVLKAELSQTLCWTPGVRGLWCITV